MIFAAKFVSFKKRQAESELQRRGVFVRDTIVQEKICEIENFELSASDPEQGAIPIPPFLPPPPLSIESPFPLFSLYPSFS